MRITDEINNLKEIMDIDPEMLIHKIYESWQRWKENRATCKDKFIIGMRYSEFLANGVSDEDYVGAERRRIIYLKRLGVSTDYINNTLKDIYGLA